MKNPKSVFVVPIPRREVNGVDEKTKRLIFEIYKERHGVAKSHKPIEEKLDKGYYWLKFEAIESPSSMEQPAKKKKKAKKVKSDD